MDFEKELAEFQPSMEIDAVEDAIVNSDLTDITDLWMQMLQNRDGKEKA